MKRFVLLFATCLIAFGQLANASIYGKLEGKVTDENGDPLIGATVYLVGTTKGAKTKPNGSYKIVGIEGGTYSIKVTYVGKAPQTVEGIKISPDQTTKINVELASESAKLKEVVVTAPMVNEQKLGTETSLGETELTIAPTNSVTQVVTYSANVVNSGSGYSIRGSRDNQTIVQVDGMETGNQFSGGFGRLGSEYAPMVSASATEEVEVKTGGFGAEYGSAMGGVVNTVVKTGRNDRFDGFVSWRTDVQPLYGSQAQDIEVFQEGVALGLRNTGEGFQRLEDQENQFEFGLGGPVPFLGGSTFYLSGNNIFKKYAFASFDINDPAGNSLGHLENNGAWIKNVTGRMKFNLLSSGTQNLDLIVGGSWGLTNLENAGRNWMYKENEGMFFTQNTDGSIDTTFNGIPERAYKQPITNQLIYNAFARINHTLSDRAYYELSVKFNSNSDEVARRASFDDPGYFSGFEVQEPVDNITFFRGSALDEPNFTNDYYEFSTNDRGLSRDGFVNLEIPVENPLSGYVEGQTIIRGMDNAYGLNNVFINTASGSGYDFRFGSYLQFDGNYNLDLESGDFRHSIKTGFELRFNEVHRHANFQPFISGDIDADIYSDRWGGNMYLFSDVEGVREFTEAPKTPWTAAFYVQDQINYKGIIFSPGLRIDYFDPQSKYRLVENFDFFIPVENIDDPNLFAEATGKLMVSPRINVSYPIKNEGSERQIISLNYGVYYRMPNLQPMFDNFNFNSLLVSGRVGDPNMDPERVNSFEVSFDWQLNDEYAFNVQSYFKDIYNELGVQAVRVAPNPYFQTAVTEYGLNRGIEFELRKRPSNNFQFRINYTLASVMGTSDNVNTNFGIQPDRNILDREVFPYPLAPYSLNRDIRHRVNFLFGLLWGQQEGPSIGNIYLLENTQIGITNTFRSGAPYTITDQAGIPLGEINSERTPNFWRLDFTFARRVALADIFGDFAGNSAVEFNFDVVNLFNRTVPVSVNTASQDPDFNPRTMSTQIGQFQNITFYEEADYSRAETFNTQQYDIMGRRMYNPASDFDNNGRVTREEMYQAYQNYVNDLLRFRGNYQAPRTVFFSVRFSF